MWSSLQKWFWSVVGVLASIAGVALMINIITIQSYPFVGGVWTTEFTTIGRGDLSISPFNGTSWEDIVFKGLRCGDEVVDADFVNYSVVAKDYSCFSTSSFDVEVVTTGKHSLQFEFGKDVGFSYNNASKKEKDKGLFFDRDVGNKKLKIKKDGKEIYNISFTVESYAIGSKAWGYEKAGKETVKSKYKIVKQGNSVCIKNNYITQYEGTKYERKVYIDCIIYKPQYLNISYMGITDDGTKEKKLRWGLFNQVNITILNDYSYSVVWGEKDYLGETYDPYLGNYTEGLVSYYNYTNDADDDWGVDDGSLVGNANISTGFLGNGANFDGNQDWINVPEDDGRDPFDSMSEVTIAFMAYVESTGNPQKRMVHKNGVWTVNYQEFVGENEFRFGIYHDGFTEIEANVQSALGEWWFVTAVYNGTHQCIYVNASLKNCRTKTGTLADGSDDLYIGIDEDETGSDYAGVIDELMIFSKALNQSTITTIFEGLNNGTRVIDRESIPVIYNLSIIEPTTSLPINVTNSTNITILFNLTADNVTLTSGITMNNVTIDGTYADILTSVVPGRGAVEIHVVQSMAEISDTAVGTFTEIATIDAGDLSANTNYFLYAAFGIASTDANVNCHFQVTGDGGVEMTGQVEPPGSDNDVVQMTWSQVYRTDGSPADVVMGLDLANEETAPDACRSKNSQMFMIDLSTLTEGVDYYNASFVGDTALTTTDVAFASVTLDEADGAKDWLVFTSGLDEIDTVTTSFKMAIYDGSSNFMQSQMEGESATLDPESAWTVFRVFDDVAVDTTFSMVSSVSLTTGSHDLLGATIFAIDLGIFESYDSFYGTSQTVPNAFGTTSTLVHTPITTGNTIILSNYILTIDNTAGGWEDQLTVDGTISPSGWDWTGGNIVRKTSHDIDELWTNTLMTTTTVDTGGDTILLRTADLTANAGVASEVSIIAFSDRTVQSSIGQQFSCTSSGCEVNVTVPSKEDGFYDLFLNATYSGILYDHTQHNAINYSTESIIQPSKITDKYFSQSGSDSNNCTFDYPCKTAAKANSNATTCDNITFMNGVWNTYYDTFVNTKNGNESCNTVYKGVNATFGSWVDLSAVGNWSNDGGNIWVSGVTVSRDVGHIYCNNTDLREFVIGNKQEKRSQLNILGEFTYNTTNDRLYIYLTSNPSTYCNGEVMAVVDNSDGNLFDLGRWVTIEGFHFRFAGVTAITGSAYNCIIRNNTIEYVGGVYQFGTLRYGNCLQIAQDAENNTVEYNTVSNCYDAGLTIQAWDNGKDFLNNTFRYNIAYNNRYNYEMFNNGIGGSEVVNGTFLDHNTFYHAGEGWSYPLAGKDFRFGLMPTKTYDTNFSNNIYSSPPYSTYGGYGGKGTSSTICHTQAFSIQDSGLKQINLSSHAQYGNVSLRFVTYADTNTICNSGSCGSYIDDFNVSYVQVVSDSCDCPGVGEDWEVDLEDNCLMGACDMSGGNLTFINTGSAYCNGLIQLWSLSYPPAGQIFYAFNNSLCRINTGQT